QAFKDLIFQSAGTGLIALDRAHRITAFNGAAEEITGVPSAQAIGCSWSALLGASVPLASIEATIDGNPRASMRHETALRRPDGSTVPVRMTFSALRSGGGERLGLISACEDLSATRAMESRMRQADRLATVGRMAANVAHDIRNPPALVRPVGGQAFRQVLWDPCLDAVEAMPGGGEPRVPAAVRGGTLEITVTDTGEGIAAGDVSHVFEPFFSTKSEGTGLGLALVHRVVQEHGGEIDVRSSPGLGTTFTLTLPSHHA